MPGIYDLRGQTALITGAAQGLGRWSEPEDIANTAAFLCSPQAGWMTGEVLRVSGGLEGVSAPLPKSKSC